VRATSLYHRVSSIISLALLLAACGGDGPSAPVSGDPGLHVVAGANVTDTVDAPLAQALVVEVRRQDGTLATGVTVRFEPQPSLGDAIYVCTLTGLCGPFVAGITTDDTDSRGRAKTVVKMGQIAGRAVVRVTVPELGLVDSAAFTVLPGAPAHVRPQVTDTTLDIGATTTLRGKVVDRYNNARLEVSTNTVGPGNAVTLDVATGTITALDIGTQYVLTHYNSFVDSTNVRVAPAGRLVVWSAIARAVRLVSLNGTGARTIVSTIGSSFGVFPRFDPTRQRITLHTAAPSGDGSANHVIVVDTTGSPRRDIGLPTELDGIGATRLLADGTVLVIARRDADPSHPGYHLWSVGTDNTITLVADMIRFDGAYAGADISHDGTRIAYISDEFAAPQLRVLNVATGADAVLDSPARSPRWSLQDDRIAYLLPTPVYFGDIDGVVFVINSDGTGRRPLGNDIFSPGLAWSPDGNYLIGRSSVSPSGVLRVVRISDGANVTLRFPGAQGVLDDYYQPDWR
jgi:hypothetical protein